MIFSAIKNVMLKLVYYRDLYTYCFVYYKTRKCLVFMCIRFHVVDMHGSFKRAFLKTLLRRSSDGGTVVKLVLMCLIRPCAARVCSPRVPEARMFYLLRGGVGCGPDQCGAGRAAGQDMSKYAGRGGVEWAELYSCGAGVGSAFSARAVSLKNCTLSVPISWWITSKCV